MKITMVNIHQLNGYKNLNKSIDHLKHGRLSTGFAGSTNQGGGKSNWQGGDDGLWVLLKTCSIFKMLWDGGGNPIQYTNI